MEKISIILVHYAMNEFRSEIMRQSILSLIETSLDAEIIVVDNGGSKEDSRFLLGLNEERKIACYIKNRYNMSFGFARNQGLDIASGDYFVITDNDILFKNGWLQKCKEILDIVGDKYLVTPLRTDRQHRNFKHWRDSIKINDIEYLVNTRAGSNCWMMTKEQYKDIGRFQQHKVAGSKWNDEFVRKGYLMITMEKEPLAEDMAFRKGYNIHENIINYYL